MPGVNDIRNSLVRAGLPPNAIAALLGHIQQESAFNSMHVGDHGTSFGLFQVGSGVWNAWTSYARANGLSPGDGGAQAKFIVEYAKNNQPNVYSNLVNAGTPSEALDAWGKWNNWGTAGRRYEYANKYAKGVNVVNKDVYPSGDEWTTSPGDRRFLTPSPKEDDNGSWVSSGPDGTPYSHPILGNRDWIKEYWNSFDPSQIANDAIDNVPNRMDDLFGSNDNSSSYNYNLSHEDSIRQYWDNFDPSDIANNAVNNWQGTYDNLFSPSDLISRQYRPTTDDSYNEGPGYVYPNTPDDAYNQSPDYVPYDSYPETPPETYDNQPSYVQPDYSEYPDQPGNIPPPPMEFMLPAGHQPSRIPPSVYGGHGIANPNAPTIQVGIRNPTGTPGGGAPVGGAGQLSTMNWANSLPSISNFYNNLGFAPGGGGYITQLIDALQKQGAPQTNSNSPGGFSPIPVELAPGGVSEEQFATWMASGGGGNSLAQLLNPPRQA